MTEIKSFWANSTPTLDDIKVAYTFVKKGFIVSLRWYVNHNGSHERIITPETVKKYTIEEYFENCIPQKYAG